MRASSKLLVVLLCALFLSSVVIGDSIADQKVNEKEMNTIDGHFEMATDVPIWNYTYDGEGNDQDDRGYSLTETSDGGFVAAGEIKNTSTFKLDFWVMRVDANGTELWSTTIDNGDSERAWDVIQVSTGGFVACGYTRLDIYTPGNFYNFFYLVKLDTDGNVDWMRNYTGNYDCEARAVAETDDGGFIIVGRDIYGGGMYVVRTDSNGILTWDTTFYDGDTVAGYDVIDLTGTNGYVVGCGMDTIMGDDFLYLLRLDESGSHVWNSTHGGPNTEYCFGMTNTTDGGYALCGTTNSWGGGGYDMYLVKFDGSGNLQWNQTYGGSGNEMCQSITTTAAGGFALAGYKSGADDDIWLVRTDSEGEVWWTEQIHYAGHERASKIVEVYDGGYALTGYVDPSVGDWDLCIYRVSEPRWNPAPLNQELDLFELLYEDVDATSTDGPVQWSINDTQYLSIDSEGILQNTTILPVGQIHLEIKVEDSHGRWIQKEIDISVRYPLSDVKFNDGNRVIAYGITESPNGDFVLACLSSPVIFGNVRPYIVRYNESGVQVWAHHFAYGYIPYDIITCSTGGYLIAGYADTTVTTDNEFWLMKIDEDGTHVWNSTFDRTGSDIGRSLVETPDGGFLILGDTIETSEVTQDFWLVRTDSSGNHLWNKTYGYSALNDLGKSVIACSGGGYAMAGETEGGGMPDTNALLVRIDESGNHLWNWSYGGSHGYYATDVVELSDGGFALTGKRYEGGVGLPDAFVIRTNGTGFIFWSKVFGGSDTDWGNSIVQLHNDSIVVAGETYSFQGGNRDGYFLLLDSDGNAIRNESIGNPVSSEYFEAMIVASAGGIAMSGRHTPAPFSGDGWLVVLPFVKWTETPSDEVGELGQPLSLPLHATSIVGVMHWWINDTANFAISQFGVVTNAGALAVNEYDVMVRAYDHAHNMIQAIFIVSIEDTTAPTWVTAPMDQEIDYLEDFSYQLEATDLSGILDWYVNDTVNFQILDSGLLINNTVLPVGEYGLNVTVLDTYGNIRAGTFTVTVLEVTSTTITTTTTTTTTGTTGPTSPSTTAPPDGTLIIIIVIGVGGLLVVIVVIFILKKRTS
jgi:hypothetical protein